MWVVYRRAANLVKPGKWVWTSQWMTEQDAENSASNFRCEGWEVKVEFDENL